MFGERLYDFKWISLIRNWWGLKRYHRWFRFFSETLFIHFYIDRLLFVSGIQTNVNLLKTMRDRKEVPLVLYRILHPDKHPSLPKLSFDLLFRWPQKNIPIYLIFGKHLFCTRGKLVNRREGFILKTRLYKVLPYIPETDYQNIDPYYKEIAYQLYRDLAYKVPFKESNLPQILSSHPGSRSNLFKIFKMVIGVSPNIVRQDQRIINFKNKLLTTEHSIHALVLESGFKSRSHLYKLFQSIYQMSPDQFRRRYGKHS